MAVSCAEGLLAGTVVLTLGFKVFTVACNRLLGLSVGTVVLQLGLHRLVTVAVNCCEGVVVVVLEVDEVVEVVLSPPPLQDARRKVEHPMRIKVISRFMIYGADV